MSNIIDYFVNRDQFDLAIALTKHMPGSDREKLLGQILARALNERQDEAATQILEMLGRPITDSERAASCRARLRQRNRSLVKGARDVAEQVTDDALRAQLQREIDVSCLHYGFVEEVSVMSPEEIIDWVAEHLRRYDFEAVVSPIIKFFSIDFEPLLKKMRAEAVTAGDFDLASRIASISGQGLQLGELIELFGACKSKLEKDLRESSNSLYRMEKLVKLLPTQNRKSARRWMIGIHIRAGRTRDARELLESLPERERGLFAERILARELDPREGVSFRDVWETEKYLGRELTLDEVRKRLTFVFVDKGVHLRFITRLPQAEQPPYLEKFVEDKVRSHDLPAALEATRLIPRDLKIDELFTMLYKASGSYDLWCCQRTPEPRMVESSRQAIEEIARHIASRSVPTQVA
ncbi:hypothetical protein KW785_00050 [Candidatus Parcubacteria bacterium]|nr:hypothetical protein [Candidatus Parcubacteria bacterium]